MNLVAHHIAGQAATEPGKLYSYTLGGIILKKKVIKTVIFCYNGLVKIYEPKGAGNTQSALTNSFNVGG
jgi:hypothetical protein